MSEYAAFFRRVTGNEPFPFQAAMAERDSPVVAAPTWSPTFLRVCEGKLRVGIVADSFDRGVPP
ncbi:MAG: hypothetical protein ACRDZO_07270, partial [Egibacteraceae bacterium]